MPAALSVLLLEDDPSSIRLFTRKVESAPVEIAVKDVRNKEAFLRALETNQFDCIVIDYTLPDITGIEALRLVNEMLPGTPSIIYTGSVGEEKAVECMKEGAMEFLLKTNSIRLVPAILSAVNLRRDHEARLRAEEAQKKSEERFRALAETSTALIFIYKGEQFTYVNPASMHITGYSEEDLFNLKFWELVHPNHREMVHQRGLARQRGEAVPSRYEFKIVTKDGKERWLDYAASAIRYEGVPAGLGIAFDVTDRKIAEEKLRYSESIFRLSFETNPLPVWLYDIDTQNILEVNNAAVDCCGYTREELLFMKIDDIRSNDIANDVKKKTFTKNLNGIEIWKCKGKNGEVVDIYVISNVLDFDGHHAMMVSATENKKQKPIKKKHK
jgi:PAS domain S-box-containing protein